MRRGRYLPGRRTVPGMALMHQSAPYPAVLAGLVEQVRYRPGWKFALETKDRGQGCEGLTLTILASAADSYEPGKTITVWHYMPVPPAAYDERSWRRWLFEQCLLVDRHEAMEFFAIGGERPFAPNHGPGRDPYTVHETGTDLDRRTSFRGEVSPV